MSNEKKNIVDLNRIRRERNAQAIIDNMDKIRQDYIRKVEEAYNNMPESEMGVYVYKKDENYGKPYAVVDVDGKGTEYNDEDCISGVIRMSDGSLKLICGSEWVVLRSLAEVPVASIVKVYNQLAHQIENAKKHQ